MKVLKESGVKWIGLAPVCWQVIPFKYCIDRRQGGDWGEVNQPPNLRQFPDSFF